MDRDMSYDLDDSFALRDAGEVQPMPEVKTRVLRTPGLAPVLAPNEITKLRDAGEAMPVRDMAGVGALEVDLPVVGKVNLLHVGLAVGATLLVCKLLKK